MFKMKAGIIFSLNVSIYSSLYERITGFYHNSNYLYKAVLFLSLLFLSTTIILAFVILITRIYKSFNRRKLNKCREKCIDFIAEWAYSDRKENIPEPILKNLKNTKKRDMFTNELLSLHSNLVGESASKLVSLFHITGLKKYSIRKIHSFRWHIKAKGFAELVQMNIKDGNSHIAKYLYSKNENLRVEAQLAWLELNTEDPVSFFSNPRTELSDWWQLKALISLKKLENIPDFGKWLEVPSRSVVQFSLRMCGIFKQFENIELVANKLNDKDVILRYEAIRALGKMALPLPIIPLQRLYHSEKTTNKAEIIKTLTMISDNLNLDFFEEVLINETNINLRLLCAKGLYSLGSSGIERLDLLLSGTDDLLKNIIYHSKDERI
jgi:hypothetical protein